VTWTYQQIIDEADERYPNSLSVSSKLRKIHSKERELFRTIYRQKTATAYDIVADQVLYPLDFHHSKIIRIVWDGHSVDYEDINNDEAKAVPFYYTYQNSLGRYPTPDRDVTKGLLIFHYYDPYEPTEIHLSSGIQFDSDFAMLLVYDLCKHLSEINRDDMVNGFIIQYNSVLDDFKRANPEPELPPMRVE
jgi:hypothetical protein